MRHTTKPSPVVIAGGGVGGLALGIKLRQFGLPSLVVERNGAERVRQPQLKGEYFQPLGVSILEELGVREAIEARAIRVHTVSHRYYDPVKLKTEKFKTKYNCAKKWKYGLAILHEEIVEEMRSKYLRLGGELIEGVRIDKLERRSDHYQLELADGRSIRAGIFVGADGRHSATRKMAGVEPLSFECQRFMAAALVTNLQLPAGEFYTEEIPNGVVYAFRYPKAITRVYVCFAKSELARATQEKDSFFLEKLAQTQIRGRLKAKIRERVMMMPTDDMMLEQPALGNGIWMGDAAGTLDPLGGHGMSVAMSQALRIANAIRVAQQVPDRAAALLASAGADNHREFLQARFLSLWIGYLFMKSGLINRIAKRHLLARYMSDFELRTYSADFFGGLSDKPVGIFDVPYMLGIFPSAFMRHLQGAKVDHFMAGLQNRALVTPITVATKSFKKRALELAQSYLRFPQFA